MAQESDDTLMRLDTIRWIESELKVLTDILQTINDLTDKEKNDMKANYSELCLRYTREKKELIRLKKI